MVNHLCEKQDVVCVNKEKVNLSLQLNKKTETDGSLQRECVCVTDKTTRTVYSTLVLWLLQCVSASVHTHRKQTQITCGYSFIPIPTAYDNAEVSLLIRRPLVA